MAAILIWTSWSIQVNGKPFNGDMPAWGQLSDEEIAGVMTYIRGSWSNKQSEVSPALVKAVRAETASQTSPWTDEGLNALAKQPPPAAAAASTAAPADTTQAADAKAQ
ncbi:MAG: cytochrome c [Bryobacterales bacterium]|nr:cytochrome c [Bryobacterales bacterium]